MVEKGVKEIGDGEMEWKRREERKDKNERKQIEMKMEEKRKIECFPFFISPKERQLFIHNHLGRHTWKGRNRLPCNGTTSTPRNEPIQNPSTHRDHESNSKLSLTNAYLRKM